jgi:MYXO-CTERM domain-containing protein
MEGISMRLPAFRGRVPGFVLLLAAMIMVMAIPLAVAQAPVSPPAQSAQTTMTDTRTDTSDDSYGEWGLLGLVGLLGLAGLMRRDRTRLGDRSLDRTTERERVGRP